MMPVSGDQQPRYFLGNPVSSRELFRGLRANTIHNVSKLRKRRLIGRGTPLFTRGDVADEVFVFVAGEAELLIETGDGRPAITRRAVPLEIFGLPEAVCGGFYETSFRTRSECLVDAIEGKDFSRLLYSEPELCFRLLNLLGTNLQRGHQLLASLGT